MKQEMYSFQDLVDLMERLRGSKGCPWDKVQTHHSLQRYLLEEAYEVLEAIGADDKEQIREELGDVLLQVVFHSQIARESGNFDIGDVVEGICRKIISRHTHVFGEEIAGTPEEVLNNWNRIKNQEKDIQTHTQAILDIPKTFPALIRSLKVQEKAARAGFDWESLDGPKEKIREELEEFMSARDSEKAEEEFGDILFSLVNCSRFMNINPEHALEKAIAKFIRRFEYMEKKCNEQGLAMEALGLEYLDTLWDKAKEEYS